MQLLDVAGLFSRLGCRPTFKPLALTLYGKGVDPSELVRSVRPSRHRAISARRDRSVMTAPMASNRTALPPRALRDGVRSSPPTDRSAYRVLLGTGRRPPPRRVVHGRRRRRGVRRTPQGPGSTPPSRPGPEASPSMSEAPPTSRPGRLDPGAGFRAGAARGGAAAGRHRLWGRTPKLGSRERDDRARAQASCAASNGPC